MEKQRGIPYKLWGKIIVKIIPLLLILLFLVSACCHHPPPPVERSQLEDLKASVDRLEKKLNQQNIEIDNLESDLKTKEAELEKLKQYKKQLVDEGFCEEE